MIRKAVSWPMLAYKRRLLQRYLTSLQTPEASQRVSLANALNQVVGSEIGRGWKLTPETTIEQFRTRVPVTSYDTWSNAIDRMLKGEQNVLLGPRARLLMFALTSGTTGRAKYIPVTRQSIQDYRFSWTVWALAIARDYPEMPYRSVFSMATPWNEQRAPGGVPIGSITGLLHHSMHAILRVTNAVPPEISQISDQNDRYYLSLLFALRRPDIMLMTAANPTTFILLNRLLDQWSEQLITDIANGSITTPSGNGYRLSLISQLLAGQKSKRLAGKLESVAANGSFGPESIWNLLSVLGVWTGGTLQQFLPLIRTHYGDKEFRDHGLSASECRVTIPLSPGSQGGPLFLQGGFFEFVPAGDKGEPLLAHQLKEGEIYRVVVTNTGGLLRYDLGDHVQCTGFMERTPVLLFLNKGKESANLTGEKITAFQISKALSMLQINGHEVQNVVLAPVVAQVPFYAVCGEISDKNGRQLCSALDRELQTINVEYSAKRNSGRLGSPRFFQVSQGNFVALKERQISSSGGTVEQYKHPCLVEDVEKLSEFGVEVTRIRDDR